MALDRRSILPVADGVQLDRIRSGSGQKRHDRLGAGKGQGTVVRGGSHIVGVAPHFEEDAGIPDEPTGHLPQLGMGGRLELGTAGFEEDVAQHHLCFRSQRLQLDVQTRSALQGSALNPLGTQQMARCLGLNDKRAVERDRHMIRARGLTLTRGEGSPRHSVDEGYPPERNGPPIGGQELALHRASRVRHRRRRQLEDMEVQLSLHFAAQVSRPPVGRHDQSAFVIRRIQRPSEVARRAPRAVFLQGADEQIQSAHAGMAIRGEIEVATIRMQEGPHFLTRCVDGLRKSNGLTPAAGFVQFRHEEVVLPVAGSPASSGEMDGSAIRTEAGLALPP